MKSVEFILKPVGTPNLDASTLQLILMNYLDPASEKGKKPFKVPGGRTTSQKMDLFYRIQASEMISGCQKLPS